LKHLHYNEHVVVDVNGVKSAFASHHHQEGEKNYFLHFNKLITRRSKWNMIYDSPSLLTSLSMLDENGKCGKDEGEQ
jgi:hypothetical protein